MNLKQLNPFLWIRKFNTWFDGRHWIIQTIIMLSVIFLIRTFGFGLYSVPTGSMEPTILVGESFFADKLTLHFTSIKRGEIISFNDPTFVYSDNFFVRLFEKYAWGPESWTKRVIGIPGDRVQGKVIQGKTYIYLNGEELEEPYVNPYPIVQVREEAWRLGFVFPGVGKTPIYSIPFMKKESSSKFRVFDPELPIESKDQPFYNLYLEEKIPNNTHPNILYSRQPSQSRSVSDIFDVTLDKDEYWCMGDNRLGSYDSRGFGRVTRDIIHGKIIFRIGSLKTANSILYDGIIMPIYQIGLYFASVLRPWDRWFTRLK